MENSFTRLTELVTESAHRADLRGVADLGAYTRHIHLDGIRRELVAPVADRVQQPILGHQSSGAQHQAFEDGPLALREPERLAVRGDLAAREIEPQATEFERRARG